MHLQHMKITIKYIRITNLYGYIWQIEVPQAAGDCLQKPNSRHLGKQADLITAQYCMYCVGMF